jgi:phosphoribosylanthranilate isomerase
MKVKVCGMKYSENMEQVATLRPDYLGFIFWKPSKRYFEGVIPDLPKNIKKVGVFVDASQEEILQKIKQYQLTAIQLHGKEDVMYCRQLHSDAKGINPKISLIKVFSIKNEFNFDLLKEFESVCDYFLFDTKGELPGGNGYVFNWEILKNYPSKTPYFLSGGIGLEETDKLIEFFASPASKLCHAIDVNSKFETAPGVKNKEMLATFMNTIRQYTNTNKN